MNHRILSNMLTLAAASFVVNAAAQDNPAAVAEATINGEQVGTSASRVRQDDEIRRQQKLLEADLAVAEGQREAELKNYPVALKKYRAALLNYEQVSRTNADVLAKVEATKVSVADVLKRHADKLVKDAADNADAALYEKARENLLEAQNLDPDRKRELAARITAVNDLIEKAKYLAGVDKKRLDEEQVTRKRSASIKIDQAQHLIADRRFTDAKDVLEALLIEDPFNHEASVMLRRVNDRIKDVGMQRYQDMRMERVAEVEWKWANPLQNNAVNVGGDLAAGGGKAGLIKTDEEGGASSLVEKLKTIIIPSADFNGMTLDGIVERLKQLSKDQDPEGKGINIILRMPQSAGAAVAAPAEAADPFAPAADPAAEAPLAAVGNMKTLKLNMEYTPIGEIIRFICLDQGLRFKVDKNAVIIADPSIPLEVMEHRVYQVPAGFLDLVQATKAAEDLVAGEGGEGGDAKNVKDYFSQFGVKFDAGATIQFMQQVSRIVMRNTPEEHAKAERIINELTPPAQQVIVETKFVEVNQTDMDELAFNWSISAVDDGDALHRNMFNDNNELNGGNNLNGGSGAETAAQVVATPFVTGTNAASLNGGSTVLSAPTALPGATVAAQTAAYIAQFSDPNRIFIPRGRDANDPFITDSRNGFRRSAVSRALGSGVHLDRDGSVSGSAATDSLSTATRSLMGIMGADPALDPGQALVPIVIGDYVFNNLIRAIEQHTNKDMLNAPKVTTQSGNTAKIRVVTERYFPTEWEPPEVELNTGGGGAVGVRIVPSKPVYDEPRDLGVVLNVTPNIDADNRSIELELKPEVVEFIDYDITFNTQMVTPVGPIDVLFQMPIFETRTIDTVVRVWDGETVALGGLIRDEKISYEDKIPYLSKIPLLGRLFTSKGESSQKQNLLIFVTTRIVTPGGTPIRPKNFRGVPDFKRL